MSLAAPDIKELANVEARPDFASLYENKSLSGTEEKIAFLRDGLGILAIRSGKNLSPDELLKDLERYALSHPWLYKKEGY